MLSLYVRIYLWFYIEFLTMHSTENHWSRIYVNTEIEWTIRKRHEATISLMFYFISFIFCSFSWLLKCIPVALQPRPWLTILSSWYMSIVEHMNATQKWKRMDKQANEQTTNNLNQAGNGTYVRDMYTHSEREQQFRKPQKATKICEQMKREREMEREKYKKKRIRSKMRIFVV